MSTFLCVPIFSHSQTFAECGGLALVEVLGCLNPPSSSTASATDALSPPPSISPAGEAPWPGLCPPEDLLWALKPSPQCGKTSAPRHSPKLPGGGSPGVPSTTWPPRSQRHQAPGAHRGPALVKRPLLALVWPRPTSPLPCQHFPWSSTKKTSAPSPWLKICFWGN